MKWFKFTPAEWAMGKISRCSLPAQGEFIHLCCAYWTKRGLTIEEAQQQCDTYPELVKRGVLKENEDMVVIEFLDEQLEDLEMLSEKRREAGRKGGLVKPSEASAKQVLSKRKQVLSNCQAKPKQTEADKIRLDKNRIEEIRQEEKEEKRKEKKRGVILPFSSQEFLSLWEQWKEYKKTEHKFKYSSEQSEQAAAAKLGNMANGDEKFAKEMIIESMAQGWKGFFLPKDLPTKKKSNRIELTNKTNEWLNK